MSSSVYRLEITVRPRANRDAVVGWLGTSLRIHVKAPPVDGKANESVVALMARITGLPKASVTIESGASGKKKLLSFRGMSEADVLSAVSRALSGKEQQPV